MADRFTAPSMDWTSTGDVHKRFKLFKQKCQLIFDGPLEEADEKKKVRLLLLWIGDKGLEIYNTATWAKAGDELKIKPVFQVLETYTQPQSNQILSRYQLRCLKQGEMLVEEFVTKARLLVEDSGYAPPESERTLRDTLVFGLKSDKVRKDAIAIGNNLTFSQIYELAKVEESTRAHMKVLAHGEDDNNSIHTVRSKHRTGPKSHQQQRKNNQEIPRHSEAKKPLQKPYKFQFKSKGCFGCGNRHSKSAICPAKNATCKFCGKVGHYAKVCLKKRSRQLHEIIEGPGYTGQEIHLEDESSGCDSFNNTYIYEEDGASGNNSDPVTVFLGSLTSESPNKPSIHSVNKYPDRIFATVKVNDKHDLSLKIDPGADTSVLTTTDLEKFPFPIEIKPCQDILTGYGGSRIQNIGYCILSIKFKDKAINAKFNIVDLHSAGPSLLGCRQSQELGIVTVHLDNVSEAPKISPPNTESKIDTPIETLSKSQVLRDYSECFDKIGRFPGEKYHITLKDNPSPVVHAPRTVPLHILPLYKAELQQMLENDVIAEVNEPTEWVNSIVCSIKEDPNGQKKVRLCLDPKDLNKSIQREHYYSRTIDEILPALYGKKYFSVVDTKKGYWHIELDHESSLLCTFNTPFGQ